jgi:hypothetical protein
MLKRIFSDLFGLDVTPLIINDTDMVCEHYHRTYIWIKKMADKILWEML